MSDKNIVVPVYMSDRTVIGHATIENREDGLYAIVKFDPEGGLVAELMSSSLIGFSTVAIPGVPTEMVTEQYNEKEKNDE